MRPRDPVEPMSFTESKETHSQSHVPQTAVVQSGCSNLVLPLRSTSRPQCVPFLAGANNAHAPATSWPRASLGAQGESIGDVSIGEGSSDTSSRDGSLLGCTDVLMENRNTVPDSQGRGGPRQVAAASGVCAGLPISAYEQEYNTRVNTIMGPSTRRSRLHGPWQQHVGRQVGVGCVPGYGAYHAASPAPACVSVSLSLSLSLSLSVCVCVCVCVCEGARHTAVRCMAAARVNIRKGEREEV